MPTLTKEFVNENGNRITISVSCEDEAVIIVASGPDSLVEHEYTKSEARVLKWLLNHLVSEY